MTPVYPDLRTGQAGPEVTGSVEAGTAAGPDAAQCDQDRQSRIQR
jgi:hypothetical protein